MDPYRAFIENMLLEDKSAPVKQRHTSARIFERLTDEYGFTGGESTVRHYLRKLKVPQQECFLKLEANPGEQMQIDFGHAEVYIDDQRVKACLFCMRLKYSLTPFVIAFPTERLEAFLEGHVQGFTYFGGIPKEGLYDNATTQVVRILSGPEREEHEWFSSLRTHYLFDSVIARLSCPKIDGVSCPNFDELLVQKISMGGMPPISFKYPDYTSFPTTAVS